MDEKVEARNVSLYPSDWAVVDAICGEMRMPVSQAMRYIVRKYAEANDPKRRTLPSRLSLTDLIAGPALEQGVVALTCGCCKKVVGVINADAARRESENGVLHFCQECMALPEAEIVARLNASVATEGEL